VVEISLLGSERARVGNRPGYSTRLRSQISLGQHGGDAVPAISGTLAGIPQGYGAH